MLDSFDRTSQFPTTYTSSSGRLTMFPTICMDRKAWRSKTTALAMFEHVLLKLDNVSCALFSDNQVLAVNKGWENMCGFSASDVVGKNMKFLEGPLQGPKTHEGHSLSSLTASLSSGTDVIGADIINYRKDRSLFTNHTSVYCLQNKNKKYKLFLGFFQDKEADVTTNNDNCGKEEEGEEKLEEAEEYDHHHHPQYDHINSALNCPICLEMLPKDDRKFVRFTCCGQGVHKTCAHACPTDIKNRCPLCRAHAVVDGSKEDIRRLLHWVERGKTWAQIILAARYFDGNGIPQSYTKAAELLKQAATLGSDPDAQFNLGLMYENGQGIEQSYECAADWYEMAIVSGNGFYPRAWFNIGVLYDCGDGFDQSFEKSRQCFSAAATQGHLVAIEFIYAIEEEEKEEKQRKLAQQVKKKIQTVVTEDVEASTCCTNCASRNTKKRKR